MAKTHAVGIDLGTTYSCIAYLNEHGGPVTLANREGELSTPSVVMFDGNEVIVGTEAMRNAIAHPELVVENAKRHMAESQPRWTVNGASYSAIDIQTHILRVLLSSARERLGPIEEAVITVPAPFGDVERKATIHAGLRAGLERVHLINEPVAASLCYVLGSEGLWFSELAEPQRILVYDLGGGTFDLSLVRYSPNEVVVIAAGGDLKLGGIDFNLAVERAVCGQFAREFGADPREDAQSRQALAIEVEQTKRSLSARSRAALTCQHAGHRKTYQIEREQFEQLTGDLVSRTRHITLELLKDNHMGWAHVDVVLTTGGASRMPMIHKMLKEESGSTLNTSLSPDLSIAHGAAYYAGMLVSNTRFARSILSNRAAERLSRMRQQSVTARSLGVLVRDASGRGRVPHYLVPASTQLPCAAKKTFGTVIADQRRVHLHVVESGAAPGDPHVELGSCVIDDLPPNLPAGSKIEVHISYDADACVHVVAKDVHGGKESNVEIDRPESVREHRVSEEDKADPGVARASAASQSLPEVFPAASIAPAQANAASRPARRAGRTTAAGRAVLSGALGAESLERAWHPVPLCNRCGGLLDARGQCTKCRAAGRKPGPPRLPK